MILYKKWNYISNWKLINVIYQGCRSTLINIWQTCIISGSSINDGQSRKTPGEGKISQQAAGKKPGSGDDDQQPGELGQRTQRRKARDRWEK